MTPPWLPLPGFYHHFKRAETDDIDVGAYEVIGTGKMVDTEDYYVIYRPLYKGKTPLTPQTLFIRPLHQFMGEARKAGKAVPRFQRITDQDTIDRLEWIRDQLYHRPTVRGG